MDVSLSWAAWWLSEEDTLSHSTHTAVKRPAEKSAPELFLETDLFAALQVAKLPSDSVAKITISHARVL